MSTIGTSEKAPSTNDASFANGASNGNIMRIPSSGNVHANTNTNTNTNTNATKTKTNPAHAMIAGYLAGSSGTIVGYPLDSLKVWVQTNTLGKNKHLEINSKIKKNKKGRPDQIPNESCSPRTKNWITDLSPKGSGSRRSSSTTAIPSAKSTTTSNTVSSSSSSSLSPSFSSMHRLLKKPASTVVRTVRALYSGVTGPLATVGMVQSVNFATYDATRRFLYHRQQGSYHNINGSSNPRAYLTEDSLGNVALSGSVGGMATALLTAPLLMIKINQQITGSSFRKAFSEIFVVAECEHQTSSKRLWRFRPFRPYGVAFVPHALSESIGRAIYVTTYEGSKRYMMNSKVGCVKSSSGSSSNNSNSLSLSLRERMVCAASSGILCWATFFPLDALRNRMYHHGANRNHVNHANNHYNNSILETVRAMHQERAFYRGFSISILRAGPVAAAVLPVYDLTLEWLSK